jgi:hypothetical protein
VFVGTVPSRLSTIRGFVAGPATPIAKGLTGERLDAVLAMVAYLHVLDPKKGGQWPSDVTGVANAMATAEVAGGRTP